MSDALVVREQELKTQALTWPEQARALRIVDDASVVAAGEMLTGIKGLRKQVDAAFDPVIAAAFAAHKTAVAAKKGVEAPLVEAEGIIKLGMGAWHTEQERRRREEEARLRAEAQRQEEEAKLTMAVALEDAGEQEAAEAVMAEPVVAPVLHMAPAVPKVAGVSYRENWRGEVTDLLSLVKYVAAHPEWLRLLEPSMPQINAIARAQRSALAIPGLRAVVEKTVAAGGR